MTGGCDVADQSSCTTESELLDISDGSVPLTCPHPDPFPYPVSFALSARANDYPVVCGGVGRGSGAPANASDTVLSECHRYFNHTWTYVGDMLEPR